MIRIIGILAISLIGFAFTSLADHLPDHLQARGRPETTLARINLRHASIRKIMRLYGQPSELKKHQPSLPNSAGSVDYYWRKSGLNLHVETFFSDDQPKWESVVFVGVGGGTARKTGRTGAGLRLGDTLADLRRVYGRRYHLRDIPKFNIHDADVQWHREEFSLVATLDRHNRITALSLFAPE